MTTPLEDCFAKYPKTDKKSVHSYLPVYHDLIRDRRASTRRFLEIGLLYGDSLRAWRDYFEPSCQVTGVDLPQGRQTASSILADGTFDIRLFDASNREQVEAHFPGAKLDIVIEDAAHDVPGQLAIFSNLWPHVAPGGLYFIEDVQDWDGWRSAFEEAIGKTHKLTVFDLRSQKGRYDDVLLMMQK